MRTQEQIVARAKQVLKDDFLGFATDVLITSLEFENAKQFLKPEVKAEEWKEPPTLVEIKAQAREYLEFAWGKAQDHRGLSASRSVGKLTEWVWLLGDDELLNAVEKAGYRNYGAPKLAVISKAWGAPMPDDAPTLNMVAGKMCNPECCEGCGMDDE